MVWYGMYFNYTAEYNYLQKLYQEQESGYLGHTISITMPERSGKINWQLKNKMVSGI